jgi:hypothetical protein
VLCEVAGNEYLHIMKANENGRVPDRQQPRIHQRLDSGITAGACRLDHEHAQARQYKQGSLIDKGRNLLCTQLLSSPCLCAARFFAGLFPSFEP